MSEFQQYVESLGLQDARIQVGRQRIYPARQGLKPAPSQIQALKDALSPDGSKPVKATVRITRGEDTLFHMSKGEVKVPMADQTSQTATQSAPQRV